MVVITGGGPAEIDGSGGLACGGDFLFCHDRVERSGAGPTGDVQRNERGRLGLKGYEQGDAGAGMVVDFRVDGRPGQAIGADPDVEGPRKQFGQRAGRPDGELPLVHHAGQLELDEGGLVFIGGCAHPRGSMVAVGDLVSTELRLVALERMDRGVDR